MSDMNNFFDDDVIDVDFDLSESSDSVEETPVVVNNTPSTGLEFDFDFSKLGIPGLIQGDIGLQVSRYAVDRIKFTTTSKSRIAIITDKVVALKTHFIEGVGSIICFNGACCRMDGMPRIKYLFPVVVYDTDKNGRPVSTSIENRVLAVGKGTYDDIMTIDDLNKDLGGITAVDLLITCKKEDYQEISIQTAGPASWKKKPELVKQVSSFWSKNMEHLYESIARQITESEFLAKVGADGVDVGPTDGDVNFEDVFK